MAIQQLIEATGWYARYSKFNRIIKLPVIAWGLDTQNKMVGMVIKDGAVTEAESIPDFIEYETNGKPEAAPETLKAARNRRHERQGRPTQAGK